MTATCVLTCLLAGQTSPLRLGDVAPAFNLTDQSGKTHQLSDYKGRTVVVMFFPKDFTPG